jgi:hypothetical protein
LSTDPRIDAYIAKAQPFARPILEEVRRRVHAAVPDADETLKWSMPTFMVGKAILLGMAAFKAHATVSFWRGKELGLERSENAMGNLGRLESVDQLPAEAEFRALLLKAADLSRTAAPAPRTKAATKPPPAIHPDFAAALAKDAKARAALDGFPPSARRDYYEWVGEAKREETRAKRIATAIEWLREGKKRNWKYESC